MPHIINTLAEISAARKLRTQNSPVLQALEERLITSSFASLTVATTTYISTTAPKVSLWDRVNAALVRQHENEYRSTLGAKRGKTGRAKFGVEVLGAVRGAGVAKKANAPGKRRKGLTVLGARRKAATLIVVLGKRGRDQIDEEGTKLECAARQIKKCRIPKCVDGRKGTSKFSVSEKAMAELVRAMGEVRINTILEGKEQARGEGKEETGKKRVGGLPMLSVCILDQHLPVIGGVFQNLSKLYTATHGKPAQSFVGQLVGYAESS